MSNVESSNTLEESQEVKVGEDVNTGPTESNAPAFTPLPKHKSSKELEIEDVLRRLQTLSSGDSLFFKKSVLGKQVSNFEIPISTDFVEGKVVCWTFDQLKQYIVVSLRPYGPLQFGYGDLYSMAIAHDVYLHKLDIKIDSKKMILN